MNEEEILNGLAAPAANLRKSMTDEQREIIDGFAKHLTYRINEGVITKELYDMGSVMAGAGMFLGHLIEHKWVLIPSEVVTDAREKLEWFEDYSMHRPAGTRELIMKLRDLVAFLDG